MAPTVKPGDMVAVLPANRYRGAGLYVVDVLGQPNIVRVHVNERGQIHVGYDSPRYTGGTTNQDAFEASLLGRVFAVCQVTDRTAMQDAGMLDGWHAGVTAQLGSAAI